MGIYIVFLGSLFGIAALFLLKYVELRREKVFAPKLRNSADQGARELKRFLIRTRVEAAKIPPFAVLLLRYFVRESALLLASLARLGEKQAHKLADMVSHKRSFERRAPRSEFLKQVEEHKSNLSQ